MTAQTQWFEGVLHRMIVEAMAQPQAAGADDFTFTTQLKRNGADSYTIIAPQLTAGWHVPSFNPGTPITGKIVMACALFFIIGAGAAFSLAMTSITEARDHELRVMEQYSACAMIGTLPTKADMTTEESDQ